MNIPQVSHPTDRPNFYIVHNTGKCGCIDVAYSYQTPIGVMVNADNAVSGWIVRENDWSNTTGKHLNWLDDGDKKARVSGESFISKLEQALAV